MPNLPTLTRPHQTLFAAAEAWEFEPALLAAGDDDDLVAPRPALEPLRPTCQPPADWVAAQAELYRSPVRRHVPKSDGELFLDLVADCLADLALGLRQHGCRTARDYVDVRGLALTVPDLDLVRVPEHRASWLAEQLDAEAAGYLTLRNDLGNLCAAVILCVAEDAEQLGAEDAEDYLRKRDRREEQRRDDLAAMMAHEEAA